MEGILPNKIVEIDVKIGICILNDLFMYLINHSVNQVKYHTVMYLRTSAKDLFQCLFVHNVFLVYSMFA